MQTLGRLGAGDVVAVITAYRDGLRAHQERINRLNVFPVPDGDTGTNMALTLQSVVEGLPECTDDVGAVARAVSRGSLMGARGNSGVILSQILRGLADAVAEAGGIDAGALRAGLARAADGAYRAVQRPVEGTILSVVRAAADAAAAEDDDADLLTVAVAVREAAAAALARTPEQLPALAAAGVVDSGGTGLLLLFDAILHVVDGRPLPEPGPEPAGAPAARTGGGAAAEHDLGPRYEVMYLLESASEEAVAAFREVWAGIGDSIVVVGGAGEYNCHIHTDDIGAAVEAALDAGRPRSIRVTDLWEEVEEERWVRDAHAVPPADDEPLACAVVAVCAGDGIARIFRSLGAKAVVAGGQSMNPSTAELLAALEAVPAPSVVVLPNNANVVPVAEAAAASSGKDVRVVPTRSVPEGFAALLDYDPEGSAAGNAAAMGAAAGRVEAGEVAQAVRAASSGAGPVEEGDWLGITRGAIRVVAPTLAEAATALLDLLTSDGHRELVTLIAGEGATAADTRRVTTWLEEHRPELGVEVHHGGQPVYPYLLAVE